jgi:DNA-binding MarR family transcriptional regulator
VDSQPDRDRSGSPDQDRLTGSPGQDRLNSDLADAFGELFEQMLERFEGLARRFSLPPFCVKALHMLGSPMAMKELGQRFHCDPSFVTSIADMLDSHGLGRRETDTRDRRIKNLVLTRAGMELRGRVEREMTKIMPWANALDADEQETLLRLVRKMIKAGQGQTGAGASTDPAVVTGGHRAGEVRREPSAATPGGD